MPHRHRKPKKVISWYDKHFTVIMVSMALVTIVVMLFMYYLYVQSTTANKVIYKSQYNEKQMREDYMLKTGDTSLNDGRADRGAIGSALKDRLKD